jgi:hypothetical protein
MESKGRGVLDTPLEPVIGRRYAPTRWRGMTAVVKLELRPSAAQRGARFAKIRCRVRRCMLSRRAVSETLRLHIS